LHCSWKHRIRGQLHAGSSGPHGLRCFNFWMLSLK
jgi:hypothetical protein